MSQLTASRAMHALRDGITAAKAGHKAEARQLLREAVEADPSCELAWLWLAGVAETPHETLIHLQRVLEINPENAQARQGVTTTRLQIGIFEAKAGRKRTARRHLLDVIKQYPDNEVALLWLGGVAETPQEAVQYLQRVLEINPTNERARDGLRTMCRQAGVAEARAGNKPAAQRYLRTVVAEQPTDALAWHWLAETADSPAEALACLDHVLDLTPDNQEALASYLWHRTRLDAAGVVRCPLCGGKNADLGDRCAACGGLLGLGDLDAFFNQRPGSTTRLDAAIAQYERQLTETSDFMVSYLLGLAYLNRQQLAPALQHLQSAAAQLPSYGAFQEQIAILERRHAANEETARRRRAQQRCLLVVDDSPTVRKLVTMTMEKEDFRVLAAPEAGAARACLAVEVPDLVLLDITMPGMDGYQLCKLITGDPRTAHVPVVMLSGKDGFFDKIRGRIAGSTEYVTKPFKPDDLLKVVQKHCLKR